ncbi:MAG: extensin family protein, partial [Pseudomonadota bacterium]
MRVILALIAALAMILRPEDVPPAFAPWAPLDLKAAPNFVTPLKLARMDGACPSILTAGGVTARPVPDRTVSEVCHIRDAVQPTRFSTARMAAEAMRCDIAIRLALWERHDLQPAAQRLLGTSVAEIRHLGAYSCRPIRTAQGGAGRMSEHSSANAFDIAGFELSDGRVVD